MRAIWYRIRTKFINRGQQCGLREWQSSCQWMFIFLVSAEFTVWLTTLSLWQSNVEEPRWVLKETVVCNDRIHHRWEEVSIFLMGSNLCQTPLIAGVFSTAASASPGIWAIRVPFSFLFWWNDKMWNSLPYFQVRGFNVPRVFIINSSHLWSKLPLTCWRCLIFPLVHLCLCQGVFVFLEIVWWWQCSFVYVMLLKSRVLCRESGCA